MIDREHKLPVKRQAEVLEISRGAVYHKPRRVSERDLLLMRKLDELHLDELRLDHPFAGSRMPRGLLRQQGVDAGRRHVGTLMKKMGIEAVHRKRNTSKPAPGHRI
jgi:putative transposase